MNIIFYWRIVEYLYHAIIDTISCWLNFTGKDHGDCAAALVGQGRCNNCESRNICTLLFRWCVHRGLLVKPRISTISEKEIFKDPSLLSILG